MIALILSSFFVTTLALLGCGALRLLWGWSDDYPNPIRSADGLKKGDILLTGKQGVLDSPWIQLANVLTRRLKHRFWTHSAVYAGDGKIWEAQPSGIQERSLQDYFSGGYYVRAFRPKYATAAVLEKVVAFCAAQQGPGYDMQGAIFYGASILIPVGFNFIFDNAAIDRLFHVEQTYFCSELVVDAFCEAGHPISPFNGWRVKPTDFIGNPLLEEVSPAV